MITVLLKLLLSAALGALIGIEREFGKEVKKEILTIGVRTSILLAMLGFFFAFISISLKTLYFLAVGFACVLVIATAAYIARLLKFKFIGTTTYVATLIVFSLGVLVALDHLLIAVVLAILTTAFLAYRREMHEAIKKITKVEIESAIMFAIIAFVILPLLPNKGIGPLAIFNPFQFWLVVVTISLIFFLAYIFLKVFAEQGLLISSFLGGFIASIPTAYMLARKAELKDRLKRVIPASLALAIAGCLLSNIVVASVAFKGLSILKFFIAPLLITVLVAFILASPYFRVHEREGAISLKSPFSLLPALEFGAIYFVVFCAIALAEHFLPAISMPIIVLSSFGSTSGTIAGLATLAGIGQLPLKKAGLLISVSIIFGLVNKLAWGYTRDFKVYERIAMNTIILLAVFLTAFAFQSLIKWP